MAIVLALGAALSNALTTILQRMAAEQAPPEDSFHLRLIVFLLKKPVWLLGMLAMIAGFLFQAFALRFGGLSTVQPILAGEIVFLLVVLWIWFRIPIGAREWIGGSAISLGLGSFLAIARPWGGNQLANSKTWLAAGVAGALFVAVTLVVGGPKSRGPAWRAVWIGSAAAIAFAFAAAIMKQGSTVSHRGWGHLFESWPPYVLVGVGLAGLYLAQNAFHAGPVGASQAALTIVDPIVSIMIGVTVFGDRIHTGIWQVTGEVVGLSVMIAGIMLLSHSSLITSAISEDKELGKAMAEKRTHGENSWAEL